MESCQLGALEPVATSANIFSVCRETLEIGEIVLHTWDTHKYTELHRDGLEHSLIEVRSMNLKLRVSLISPAVYHSIPSSSFRSNHSPDFHKHRLF